MKHLIRRLILIAVLGVLLVADAFSGTPLLWRLSSGAQFSNPPIDSLYWVEADGDTIVLGKDSLYDLTGDTAYAIFYKNATEINAAETDPTLIDDAVVTVGDGAGAHFNLTADVTGNVDGVMEWAEIAWHFKDTNTSTDAADFVGLYAEDLRASEAVYINNDGSASETSQLFFGTTDDWIRHVTTSGGRFEMSSGLKLLNGGFQIEAGNDIVLGTTQWDFPDTDSINGAVIEPSTIDDRAIAWGTSSNEVSATDMPDFDDMTGIAAGDLLIGQADAAYDEVAMSGDATIGADGVVVITADSITSTEIGDEAVGSTEIANYSIVSIDIAPEAVNHPTLAPSAVETGNIKDKEVRLFGASPDIEDASGQPAGTIIEWDGDDWQMGVDDGEAIRVGNEGGTGFDNRTVILVGAHLSASDPGSGDTVLLDVAHLANADSINGYPISDTTTPGDGLVLKLSGDSAWMYQADSEGDVGSGTLDVFESNAPVDAGVNKMSFDLGFTVTEGNEDSVWIDLNYTEDPVELGGGEINGTLTVPNGGTGAVDLTHGGVLLGQGTGAFVATAVLADGELLIGDGTTDPVLGNIIGTANEIDVINSGDDIQVGLLPHAASHEVAGNDLVDHDNLTNFAATEHVDWAGANTGVIHAKNLDDIDTEAEFEADLFTLLTPGDIVETVTNGETGVVDGDAVYDWGVGAFEAIASNDFDPDRLAGDSDDDDLVDADIVEDEYLHNNAYDVTSAGLTIGDGDDTVLVNGRLRITTQSDPALIVGGDSASALFGSYIGVNYGDGVHEGHDTLDYQNGQAKIFFYSYEGGGDSVRTNNFLSHQEGRFFFSDTVVMGQGAYHISDSVADSVYKTKAYIDSAATIEAQFDEVFDTTATGVPDEDQILMGNDAGEWEGVTLHATSDIAVDYQPVVQLNIKSGADMDNVQITNSAIRTPDTLEVPLATWSNPEEGSIYWNGTTDSLFGWTGGAWILIGPDGNDGGGGGSEWTTDATWLYPTDGDSVHIGGTGDPGDYSLKVSGDVLVTADLTLSGGDITGMDDILGVDNFTTTTMTASGLITADGGVDATTVTTTNLKMDAHGTLADLAAAGLEVSVTKLQVSAGDGLTIGDGSTGNDLDLDYANIQGLTTNGAIADNAVTTGNINNGAILAEDLQGSAVADGDIMTYSVGANDFLWQTPGELGIPDGADYLALAGGIMTGEIIMSDTDITRIDSAFFSAARDAAYVTASGHDTTTVDYFNIGGVDASADDGGSGYTFPPTKGTAGYYLMAADTGIGPGHLMWDNGTKIAALCGACDVGDNSTILHNGGTDQHYVNTSIIARLDGYGFEADDGTDPVQAHNYFLANADWSESMTGDTIIFGAVRDSIGEDTTDTRIMYDAVNADWVLDRDLHIAGMIHATGHIQTSGGNFIADAGHIIATAGDIKAEAGYMTADSIEAEHFDFGTSVTGAANILDDTLLSADQQNHTLDSAEVMVIVNDSTNLNLVIIADDGDNTKFTTIAANDDFEFEDEVYFDSAVAFAGDITVAVGVNLNFSGASWINSGGSAVDAKLDSATFNNVKMAESFMLPNDPNPTTDTTGEIAIDTDAPAIEVYDTVYDASMLIPFLKTASMVIEPGSVTDSVIMIPIVNALTTPHGIEIVSLTVTTKDSSVAYVCYFDERSDPLAQVAEIDTITVAQGTFATTSTTFTDATIAVANDPYIHVTTATDPIWIAIEMVYYIIEGD